MKIPGMVGGLGPDLVDQVVAAKQATIDHAKERKEKVVAEKNDYTELSSILGDLGSVSSNLKSASKFTTMKVESSHPDILDGEITGSAVPGTYEMKVNGLARTDKLLDIGFADPSKSPVGFGHMAIERDDGKAIDVTIKPGSSLNDVASEINSLSSGLRATVVNTGISDEPFRLMVASTDTGKAARISFDEDTTFLEMDRITNGRDLDMSFEDVKIARSSNELKDLLDGVKFTAKQASPDTSVQVNITHDVDKTMEGIQDFVGKYNAISDYANKQFSIDPSTGSVAGSAKNKSDVRTISRSLKNALSATQGNGKYQTLAQIGISTNAKTGTLEVDDTKLKRALELDYDNVRELFVASEKGDGVASRLAGAIKRFQDPVSGVLKTRMKGLDSRIRRQDLDIEKQSRKLEEKKEHLQSHFAKINSRISNMQAQSSFLTQRFSQPSQQTGGSK